MAVGSLAQAPGEEKKEKHLKMDMQECRGQMECDTIKTSVVLDSNWRWVHETGGYTNCYTGNLWDETLCPDPETCTENCVLEGVDSTDWAGTYGVESDGKGVTLTFATKGPYSTNIGSRMYM